jgi:hypothetical protein
MPSRCPLAHALPAGKTNFPINLHGENTPALPDARKGQSGRVLIRQQRDYPAATVADFSTAVLTFFAYATNYPIDTDHAVILDVEASWAIRQAEVAASRIMLDRTAERFGLKPQSLVADSAYGSAENVAWLVKQRGIAPHIPLFDKSNRTDGTLSRSDFVFDAEQDRYTCPEGKHLVQFHRT